MPAAIGLVDIALLAALAVLIALSTIYTYSLGAVLRGAASLLNLIALTTPFGTFRPLGFAADAIDKVDHGIRHALGVAIENTQAAWNTALHRTAEAVHWIGHEIAALAHDTAQAVEGVTVTQVTNVYRKVNPALARKVGALAAAVAVLERRLTHVVAREAHTATAKATAVEHAIALPGTDALPKVIPRVKELEQEAEAALKRAREFARRFGPAALLGTIAFALGKLGITWARCSNVNKVGKRACGMNPDLLESLLADTLLVAGTISVVEFAKELLAIETEVVAGLRAFVREI